MARAKDLAALAGLAGLAYAMRNKDKSNEDAGDQKTSSYTGDTKKVEAKDEPFKATHGSSYTPGNAGTARLGVGNATNDPIVKPPKVVPAKPAAADEPAGLTTPVSSANRTDQLANLSRAVKREAKTKQFAADVPYQESAQKTDALAVASRAARAADARRRAAKQSSYKSGGMVSKVSSASSRADGIASRGKTRGKIC